MIGANNSKQVNARRVVAAIRYRRPYRTTSAAKSYFNNRPSIHDLGTPSSTTFDRSTPDGLIPEPHSGPATISLNRTECIPLPNEIITLGYWCSRIDRSQAIPAGRVALTSFNDATRSAACTADRSLGCQRCVAQRVIQNLSNGKSTMLRTIC